MIPKRIHYIWFGKNEMPELVKRCISSCKSVMSDYEFVLWTEDNYDVEKTLYTKQAYEAGKYAFVSDYARLDVLNRYGGIYLDTDVEVFKRFDDMLALKAFSGFEGEKSKVNPGISIGAEAGMPILGEILQAYGRPFIKSNGEQDLTTIVQITTDVLKEHGLKANGKTQTVDGFTVFERNRFAPKLSTLNRGSIPDCTYSAHLYAASWVDPDVRERMKKPQWKALCNATHSVASVGKKIMGEENWARLRNRYFKDLHDKMTSTGKG